MATGFYHRSRRRQQIDSPKLLLQKDVQLMGILIRRRKTETVTITHEFVRLHRFNEATTGWCRDCANETKLLPPEAAAILTGLSTRELYRNIEIGKVHFTEFSRDGLLICLNSIFQTASNASSSTEPVREISI